MERLNRITKTKFVTLFFYYLTFFTPIYSQILFGSKFKVSISELSAGTFFLIFYLFLIVCTFFSKFVFEKFFKYTYLITLGFMLLLSLVLGFFKEELSTLRLTWYFQLILIGILVLAHFKEEMTLNIYDKTSKIVIAYSNKLQSNIKKVINKNKNNENEKKVIKKEEDIK